MGQDSDSSRFLVQVAVLELLIISPPNLRDLGESWGTKKLIYRPQSTVISNIL